MRQDISDQDFLAQLTLPNQLSRQINKSTSLKDFHSIALKVAEHVFSKPFTHPILESELDYKAKYILTNLPSEVKLIKEIAEYTLLSDQPKKPKGMSEECYKIKLSSPASTRKSRASGAYLLARLFHLTKNKKYLKHSIKIAKDAIEKTPPLQDGEHPATFSWHAKNGPTPDHRISHVVIELISALPFYRTHLSAEEKLFFLKTLLTFTDFHYQSIKNDIMFNLPLSLLTAVNLVACVFPQFTDSSKWIKWSYTRTEQAYTSKINSTEDGYFREGLGYQKVVHNELLRNLLYWRAAKIKISPKLYQVVKNSFHFATQINRPDGTIATITDTMIYPGHEFQINNEHLLHLAAGFFNTKQFKELAGQTSRLKPCEEVIWDMPNNQLKKWHKWKTTPYKQKNIKNQKLIKAGFSILGAGTGPKSLQGNLVYAQNINHSHHDIGSVDLWAHGRPLITDPGFSGYSTFNRQHELSPESHSSLCLSRYQPFGPRLEGINHVKCTQFIENKEISYSTIQIDLYEKHTIYRTLTQINPTNQIENAFWIITDSVKRKDNLLKDNFDIIDTYFHFNAPETLLSVDHEKFACWSNHSGKNKKIDYYNSEDRGWEKPIGKFSLHDFLKATDRVDSNANLYIQALPNQNNNNLIFCLKDFQGYTCEYFGKVKRPSVNFCANGAFPFTMSYILIPFRGISKKALANIEYSYEKNNLNVCVEYNKNKSNINIENTIGAKPKFKLFK